MSAAKTASEDRPMQVVVRALTVMTTLAENPHGLTLPQLSEQLDIPLASVYRLIGTLESEGFAVRSPSTKRYSLGPAARRLGVAPDYTGYLVAPPEPLLALASATGETAFLTQLIDSRVVCIALVESPHPLRLFVRIGQEMPLHSAASARSILAFRDPVLVEALLTGAHGASAEDRVPGDVRAIVEHLDGVRAHGFDICENELDDDVWAVGAPVYGSTGRAEYSIAIAAAASRMRSPERRATAVLAVLEAARKLSAEHGQAERPPLPTKEDVLRHLRDADDRSRS